MSAQLKYEQGSPEWLAMRRTKIGASDAPIIMGVSPWTTPLQLWEQKVMGTSKATTFAMQEGIDWEPKIREWYSNKTGLKFQPEVVSTKEKPWMIASLDGIATNKKQVKIIEIKRCGEEDFEVFRSGKIPEKYFPQGQHAMYCAMTDAITFIASHKEYDPIEVDLENEPDYVQEMLEKEEEFYHQLMTLNPPPMCARDRLCMDENAAFVHHWQRATEMYKQIKSLDLLLDREKDVLKTMSDGRSVEGKLGKMTGYIEKGRVDYTAIPELLGVDLDSYRKDPIQKWKFSFSG